MTTTGEGLTIGTPAASSHLDALQFAPPYPGISVVAPALVPPPPLLDAEWGDEELAAKALDAYRKVAAHRTRRRCFILRSGPGRFFRLILEGARKMLEFSIPPIAWCAWSWDLWHVRSRSTPPIHYVFGARRIEQRRGWFRSEALAYLGGAARYGEAHRKLLSRWESMAADLRRTDAKSEAEVRAAIARWFPDGKYERMIAEARAEASAEDARLHEALERGEWLW